MDFVLTRRWPTSEIINEDIHICSKFCQLPDLWVSVLSLSFDLSMTCFYFLPYPTFLVSSLFHSLSYHYLLFPCSVVLLSLSGQNPKLISLFLPILALLSPAWKKNTHFYRSPPSGRCPSTVSHRSVSGFFGYAEEIRLQSRSDLRWLLRFPS